MKAAKIVFALGVVVLLATFGITNIGGDTWVTASAPLSPGWMRNPTPMASRSPINPLLWPTLMVLVLAGLAVIDAVLRTPPAADGEDESDDDVPPAP